MAKKKKFKNKKRLAEKWEKGLGRFILPEETRRLIWAVVMLSTAVIVTLSFFELAGMGGRYFMKSFTWLFGRVIFIFPVFLILAGLALYYSRAKKQSVTWLITLAISFLILGMAGIFESLSDNRAGGWIGYLAVFPFLKIFGQIAAQIIFGAVTIIGVVILWQFLKAIKSKHEFFPAETSERKAPLIKRIFAPKFKVKSIPAEPLSLPETNSPTTSTFNVQTKSVDTLTKTKSDTLIKSDYKFPVPDLLEADRGVPTVGDIRINSAIIKRTLQNFDIQVEMSEINIGPTVTQYTLKPAEGVKLAKITVLSNDLSLALASHPIRIEAPIPGRPLVGIEVPNRIRVLVRLKNLIEHQNFQNNVSTLVFALGRDVSGFPVFADLSRMPHLLVAGSTGTGKTICLNAIILSFLFQNSPETLRLILIDPKRVEFSVFNDIPHLLTPVIFDVQKTVNVLKWLIQEMERRFQVFSAVGAKDIISYNKAAGRGTEKMPYIVLVIDELADLMAVRGREIEAGIVRLAQMARAVGIHLIIATQRPSVEVITGLIKANIASRVTFQVASQVDSRTVLDMAGAEKLLGLGDLLFVSAEIAKPKRIQGVYISEKEMKKVVRYIKEGVEEAASLSSDLSDSVQKSLETSGEEFQFLSGTEDDPLYEEAKKLVIESKKASASLFQRRLRVGYARAARLIDMLEEKGVVGPGDGAKPREVFFQEDRQDEDGWQKI